MPQPTVSRDGILLVGGNGFLGLALARALAAAGREPHVLSRTTQPGRRDGIAFHCGSQDDPDIVSPLLLGCGTLVHLASTTTPGLSAGRSSVDAIENLLPAARLLEIMATCPPERLVFVSSGGAIYGNPRRLPADESEPPNPLSSHAAGKAALEAFFTSFAHCHGIPLTILRPSNLYGPGQEFRSGFGLVRTMLGRALRGEPVEVWGDGQIVRDYLFIDDAVDACLRLLRQPERWGTFNIGSGTGTSILELIGLVQRVTGRNLAVRAYPSRPVDVRAIVLDSARLATATGWEPRTPLEQGLRHTWSWLSALWDPENTGNLGDVDRIF
jgi:UDP-glucose 4-epimerase